MPINKLESLLVELETELENTEDLDENTREHLYKIQSEIRKLMEWKQEQTTVLEDVQNNFSEFESRYPKLTRTIEKITETLSQMGI